MAKFNNSKSNINKTTNNCGITAYKMNDKEKLITQVLTTFFNEQKYYGDNSKEIINTINSVLNFDPKFVANLALFTREQMNLRTISHVLSAEISHHINGKPYARKLIKNIIKRADDMSEILSYYLHNYKKPIPNSMKKGLADAFLKFDEYQLQKYNRAKEVKLSDILCITHPKALNNEQNDLWKRLLEDKLKTPITWETELSSKGNNKEVWENLIESNKLGYMAMMRNLRNIIKSGASNINKVYEFLSDENNVLKSKQLPFRYYSAYNVLKNENLGTSKIFDTLEKAIKISCKNISELKGKTLIAADVSGSMGGKISIKSEITCAEIAVLMMAIANYICEETITTTFDTSLKMCNLSTSNGIISNANSINVNGGGTDITLPIQYLLQNKIFVDRIILFSDNEINSGWNSSYGGWLRKSSIPCQLLVEQYKNTINPNIWVHAIDLQGYGTQQFKGKNVNIMAGWSEKVLEFINLTEKGTDSLSKRIEGYYFK
jgi:60 kDa SS-A/Ro ribonucleoprotein